MVAEGHDLSRPRKAGSVTLRWFGGVSGKRTFRRRRVASALAAAAETWFASNHCPDAFVMLVVIERDGATMSDEEADAYIRQPQSVKAAVRRML